MLVPVLIGVVVGAGLTLIGIFSEFKVRSLEWWEEYERKTTAAHSCVRKMVAENAQLRVALSAAEMTEDAKKVAAMTMAALDADIGVEKGT
jgi:hypothetical protein